jgi:hypothetical protein
MKLLRALRRSVGVPQPIAAPHPSALAERWGATLHLGRGAEVRADNRRFTLAFLLPAWLAAGFADYLLHRRTHIERTSGAREAALHLLMQAEAGIPTLMALLLEVNTTVLFSTVAGLVAHEATVLWDVAYAEPRRRTSTNEQHVHSFLEALPFVGTAFLLVLHWEHVRGVLTGKQRPDFGLRWKRPSLPPRALLMVLGAVTVFEALPYAEEFWRCWRTRPTLAPTREPSLDATPTLVAPDGERGEHENGITPEEKAPRAPSEVN